MKLKIKRLDPCGVVDAAEELELSIIVKRTEENGFKKEVQPDGIVFEYEPMRQFRYYLEIGDFTYWINDKTGELNYIGKTKREKRLD